MMPLPLPLPRFSPLDTLFHRQLTFRQLRHTLSRLPPLPSLFLRHYFAFTLLSFSLLRWPLIRHCRYFLRFQLSAIFSDIGCYAFQHMFI